MAKYYLSDMLTNEGARPIVERMSDGESRRIALVDCQTKYKRGDGWKTACDERDAIAGNIVNLLNGQ